MTSNVSFPDLGPRTEGEEDKEARLVEGLAGLPDQLFPKRLTGCQEYLMGQERHQKTGGQGPESG